MSRTLVEVGVLPLGKDNVGIFYSPSRQRWLAFGIYNRNDEIGQKMYIFYK